MFTRPTVGDSGEFTVAGTAAFADYNNNTGAANSLQNTMVLSTVQPSPFFFDRVDGRIVLKRDGDLMASVEVTSTDPMRVVWRIRPAAVWSDGIPVSCKDFHLQWLAATSKLTRTGEDGTPARIWDTSPTGYEHISQHTCADNGKTVITDFSTSFADYRSLYAFMVPAHILERATGIADITHLTDADPVAMTAAAEFFNTGWIGFDPATGLSAGPYRIQSTNPDETVLVRNDTWWGAPGGPSQVTFRVNQDTQAAALQLQNKEVDIIAALADATVTQLLRDDSSVTIFTAPGQTYEHLDFRMDHPMLRDTAVRQAIAACIDRQDLVDKLIKDIDPNAVPLGSLLFTPTEVGYQDHYADTGNIDTARRILSAAGYAQGADGIFAKDGQRLSVHLGHRSGDRRNQTTRLIQSHCAPAGIEMLDDATDNFNDTRIAAGEFDLALFAWVGSPVKSSSYGNYASADAGGNANHNKYSNREVDTLLARSNTELDFDKRIAILNDADTSMRADLHSLPLFALPDFAASDKTITPISYIAAAGGVTWNMFAWQRNT